jgi:hypothetical protein
MDDAVLLPAGCEEITELATFSIYHGRELKGLYVVLESGEFEALDRTSTPLGSFSKAKDTRRAIADAWECTP